VGNVVFATGGEIVVIRRERNCPIGKIGVIDSANNGMAGIGQAVEIVTGEVVGACSDRDGGGDPAA
jgi:hypothetical protein